MGTPLPNEIVNWIKSEIDRIYNMNDIKKTLPEIGAGMKIAIIYILISILTSTIGQLLLKKGMNDMGSITLSMNQFLSTAWKMITNPYVLIGLVIYFAGTIFWLAAISRVDLSYAYPFASLGYVIMLVASWLMFDEKITLGRLLGTFVIGIGVFLIYRN